ncbi:hypothetical protein GCM10010406_12790 [Streptomyces thermolineatus]|uniref:Pectate lyase n=1 Tax=Streptomyces thermolineatus TaxID=44033 RepID=A0ABN3L8S2_9ACTN
MSRRRRRGRHRRPRTLSLTAVAVVASAAAGVYLTASPRDAGAAETTVVVSPDGDDANTGSVGFPFRTLEKALSVARPGTTVRVRAGTYRPSETLRSSVDGSPEQRITVVPYGSEDVRVDGSALPDGASLLELSADYWTVSGIEFRNAPGRGVVCTSCTGGLFDDLAVHDNGGNGFTLRGHGTDDNLVRNLDSYGNHDDATGGRRADGIAFTSGSGTGNRITGARVFDNSDDGVDLWMWADPVTIERTWAFGNGKDRWGIPGFEGEGNGFRLGGGDPAPSAAHVVNDSAAWDNALHGFTESGNTGGLLLARTTAYANGARGYYFPTSATRLVENLAVANTAGKATTGDAVLSQGNNWDEGVGTPAFTGTDATAVRGPRAADGSLPDTGFLRTDGEEAIGVTGGL